MPFSLSTFKLLQKTKTYLFQRKNRAHESEHDDVRVLQKAWKFHCFVLGHTLKLAFALSHINEAHSATRNLPPEILSTIFCFACEPRSTHEDHISYPGVLAAVSIDWWRVVNTTPQLWTHMGMEVFNENVHRIVTHLRRCFHKSGRFGVDVDLDFQQQFLINYGLWQERLRNGNMGVSYPDDEVFSPNAHEALDPLRTVIFDECPERVRKLRFLNAPGEWFNDRSLFSDRFILLESICLSWECRNVDTKMTVLLDFMNLPNLKELFLFGLPSQKIQGILLFLIPKTLTMLHFSQIDYNICVLLFIDTYSALRIPSYSMKRPSVIGQTANIPTIVPTQIPHLKNFEWSFAPMVLDYPYIDILNIIITPSLCTLTLHEPWETMFVAGLNGFLARLPKSCHSVTLATSFTHASVPMHLRIADTLTHIPTYVSHVELRSSCMCLTTSICNYTGISEVSEALKNAFHKVTKISVVKASGSEGVTPDCCTERVFNSSKFVRDMNRRTRMGSKLAPQRFCLEYDANFIGSTEWKESDKKRLRELVVGGLDLEILEDGKQVEWFQGLNSKNTLALAS